MPRGYEWAVYRCDSDEVYGLLVDGDLVLQPQRGWDFPAAHGIPPMPRGWAPRYVMGIEPLGYHHKAIVATLDCDLWTGIRNDFDIVDTNGELQTCLVYRRVQERTRRRP